MIDAMTDPAQQFWIFEHVYFWLALTGLIVLAFSQRMPPGG
jgi:hypothetical protein